MGRVVSLICKICSKTSSKIFRQRILDKYDVDYFQCSSCGFIQTEEPYWLKESYLSPINTEDTGIIKRNILLAKRTSAILFFMFDKKGSFLDYGGGYGLFVRLMRDYGFNFYWSDPFTENLFARGFEYDAAHKKKIELVTSFECFEHFADPMQEIEKMISISRSILFSTETFVSGTPNPDDWKYYYFSHGQHISLFSLTSLRYIANKYDLHLYTNGKSFHLLTHRSWNNSIFNILLKLSLLGLHSLIPLFMGSNTKIDSAAIGQTKSLTHENIQ
jgi:Methyltransferase domain